MDTGHRRSRHTSSNGKLCAKAMPTCGTSGADRASASNCSTKCLTPRLTIRRGVPDDGYVVSASTLQDEGRYGQGRGRAGAYSLVTAVPTLPCTWPCSSAFLLP
jgi:hypothetical protein